MATEVCGGATSATPGKLYGQATSGGVTGSDVVVIRQSNWGKTLEYVGQASRRYRKIGVT